MKKSLLLIGAIVALGVLGFYAIASGAANPPALGGTGTSVVPSAGMVLIGNGAGTYTPAYLSCVSGCSVSNASGSVGITVPTATGTSIFAGPYIMVTASGSNGYTVQNIGVLSLSSSSDIGVSNATGTGITFSFLNPKGYATTTIQSVLSSLSAIGLASYNSSTGQFSVSSSSLNLKSASQYNFSDFLPSSTVYVANTNGNWVGTWQNKNTADFLASSTTYVSSFNTRTGAITLTSADVTTALGYTPLSKGILTINGASSTGQTFVGNTGLTVTTVTGSTNSTTTFTNTGVTSFNGATGSITYAPSTTIPTIFVTTFNGSSGVVTYAPSTTIPTSFVSTFNGATGTIIYSPSTTIPTAYVSTFNGSSGAIAYAPSTTIPTNNNQLANGAGYGTSNVSTSTANAFSALQSLSGGVNVGSSTSSSVDTYVYAAATSSGDYGTYLNTLCPSASVASGTTIMLPQENVTFASSVIETSRCTYQGAGGNGTIWNWNGGTSTPMTQMAFAPTPHITGGGFQDITFVNANGNATTTNPTIAILEASSSQAGGAHSIVQYNTFVNFGQAIVIGSGTYDNGIYYNTFRGNGNSIVANPASNSGESVHIAFNWIVDSGNGSAVNCIWFATSSVEQADMTDNTTDNCQIHVGTADQVFIYGDEVENAGGTDGSYVPIVEDSDSTNNLVISGLQVMNDGSLASTTYPGIFSIQGNASINGVTIQRNGSDGAISTPLLFSTISGNDNLIACDIVNVNAVGYASYGAFSVASMPSSTFNGCVQAYHGSYAFAWTQQANNKVQFWDGGGNAATFSTGPSGGGFNGGMTFELGGLGVGTSTVSDDGTLGLRTNVSAASFPITGPEAQANGYSNYIFTGSSVATDTLPLVSSSTFREYTFYDRGTAALSIAASSTDFINNAAATSTVFSLVSGHGVTLVDDGTYWDVIMKD